MNAAASAPPVSERVALVLLFVIPAFWSTNYLIARWAPGEVSPHVLAFSRWVLAGLILSGFAWREILEKRHAALRNAWHFFALGALGMWICGAGLYIGGRTTSATNIGLIYALSPVFIVIASAFMLGERLRAWQWGGIALAMLGLLYVVLKGQWAQLARVEFSGGDIWVLLCSVAWAVYSILLKYWHTPFSPLARLVLTAWAGCILMIPFVALELLWGEQISWLGSTAWGWKTYGLIVLGALLPGAGAYWTYSVIQRSLGAARTAMALYLGPVYGAALAWVVLGEPVRIYHLIGAGFIFAGLALVSKK